MRRADLLAADLEAAMLELSAERDDCIVAMRFLDRLSRLKRVRGAEHRAVVGQGIALRDLLGDGLGRRISAHLDLEALESSAARLAMRPEPACALDLGIEVLMIAEIAPWLPAPIDLEPILAWWEVAPASYLPLVQLAAHRFSHDSTPPPRVKRVLRRMSHVALAVLEASHA